ncbi:MAG: hypothetical protein PHV78_03540 [Patescibacteria group bacterium]|nr:hypothetical protein [Patescibacteria group bacterium]MDD5121539.1 hypothetical protein [Patescibacteria group bacterium]MDD5222324.1 hypothetical protein [Patescibacteria group bacterium]MDD5396297.1 hypothetical protein [Patescibacteria group bacterium]
MNSQLGKKSIGIIALLLFFAIPNFSFALTFDPNYIISDHELTNWQSATKDEIIGFLKGKGGALSAYYTSDLDNQVKHAGEIIYNAATRYQINPLVIVTIVQKEQTLVTRQAIKSTQYDWATGFACYDNRNPVSRFSGFTIQVDRTAWRLRYFLEHPWEFTYRAGQVYKISGRKVRPQNLATAALYNYTPYINGNKLFWQIWQSWFAKKGSLPNGSLVRAYGEKGVWLIQNNLRRPFYSRAVFLASYSFSKVKEIPKEELNRYEVGEPMSFSNYSLLKASGGEVFLLVDGYRRKIASDALLKEIGFLPQEIIPVEQTDLLQYPEGKTIATPYPSGAILQDKGTNLIYYIQENLKYPIIDEVILYNNFPYDQIIDSNTEELANFITTEPLRLRDGTLVKNSYSPAIYVIAQGKKMPIANMETFDALGYNLNNVLYINDAVLNLHPAGDILDIKNISRL